MTRNHDGVGLGLPLTKRLIELHGGTIDLASAPGKGTIASIHLPEWRICPEPPVVPAETNGSLQPSV
jgi:signal transduction histidine kinase